MPPERAPDERSRIRAEFERRDAEPRLRERYRADHPAVRFEQAALESGIRDLLARHGRLPLTGRRILDVGCGTGGRFETFMRLGADADRLCGIDLSANRLAVARKVAPAARLIEADATQLPFADGAFDLVAQFTTFTSILDDEARRTAAREIVRVLRRGGAVLWYDFRVTPRSSRTRGIGAGEIRELYPGGTALITTVTLAPPLARVLLPRGRRMAEMLQRVPLLRTHHLALVLPDASA